MPIAVRIVALRRLPSLGKIVGRGQRQHHLVGDAERQAVGGRHFVRQRGIKAQRLYPLFHRVRPPPRP